MAPRLRRRRRRRRNTGFAKCATSTTRSSNAAAAMKDYEKHLRVVRQDPEPLLKDLEPEERPCTGRAALYVVLGGVAIFGLVFVAAWVLSKILRW